MTTLIVALDLPRLDAALEFVDRLGPECDFFKVGSELFAAAGPEAVRSLRQRGKRVFLDLKFHDIPNTVRMAAAASARAGAALITVHASGGREMMEAAVEGAREGSAIAECGVLAVSILTSLDASLLGEVWGRKDGLVVTDEVVRLASLASSAGARGVVCSGQDAPRIRAELSNELELLVPGVRFAGGDEHDQKRVVTPTTAAAAGATYVVMGRPIAGAPRPRDAMLRAVAELGVGNGEGGER